MKRKLLLTLVFILATAALTACSCSISPGASPSPSPSALTATPSPTQSATASPSPMESAATTPGASAASPSPESSAQTGAALDLDALAQEVEKLSEVSLCDVVAEGDRAVVGLSFDAQYFSKLFNQEVRCSFPQYLTEKRLLYAYKLLSGSGSIPIQEVCQRCGYSSRTYFTASFKKRFGIPPSKVRYFHSEG